VALAVDLRPWAVGKMFIESKVVEMAKRHLVSSVSRMMTIGLLGSVKRNKIASPIESAYVTVACSPKLVKLVSWIERNRADREFLQLKGDRRRDTRNMVLVKSVGAQD
jgi:hypothetical protein